MVPPTVIFLQSPTKVVDIFDDRCCTTIKVGVEMNRRSLALKQLPPMELSMMHVLWEHGPSQVQQIRDRLEGDPAYTTVQTVLNKMERKGRVKRSLSGRAYIYTAALKKDAALGSAATDLVQRVFQGSVESLLMSLVKCKQLDEAALRRLDQLIAEEKE
jgi:predicted transcriptional regulator